MDFIMSMLVLIVLMLALNFALNRYDEYQRKKRQDFLDKIEVLKIVTKHECHSKYKDDPKQFEAWVSKYLRLKGYQDVIVTPAKGDGGKDVIALDKDGQKVYVECKLWDPANWEHNVGRPDAQKLVGAMYADGIKRGMIITTADFTPEAREYIDTVNKKGMKIELINGETLMTDLYDLREMKLNELVKVAAT